jgi:hypothetical protein
MANPVAEELRRKMDAARASLTRQLEGMDAFLDRSDAPGAWTTREVLSHLLFEPGWDPVARLTKFSDREFPLVEVNPGHTSVSDERRGMTLRQFVDALDRQRRDVLAYVDGLTEAELKQRKARIPLFKQIIGTDEVPLEVYVGALFDFHWNDHAGQLAKIRKAVGLPDAA